jgi:hypothetical protein
MKNEFATLHEADNQTLARHINRYGLPAIIRAFDKADNQKMTEAHNKAQAIREAHERFQARKA